MNKKYTILIGFTVAFIVFMILTAMVLIFGPKDYDMFCQGAGYDKAEKVELSDDYSRVKCVSYKKNISWERLP